MREILFRGKSKINNNNWYYGAYKFEDGIHWIIENGYEAIVEPETVGQYTGLEDKKGQKIFEGDILRTDLYRGENAKVVFEEGCFMTQTRYTTDVLYDMYYLSCEEGYILFEVIGNIHDNPELLKEREE